MDLFGTTPTAPAVCLTGERICLRPGSADDWAAWVAVRERSRDFLVPWEPMWPADCLTRPAWHRRLKRLYEDWQHDLAYSFLSFRLSDGVIVGGLSLTNVRRGVSQSAMLGYWVGQPFARQGYTGEAVALLLDYAFGPDLSLHRIEAGCLPRNLPSRGLLQKLRFQQEGLARAFLKINGVWEDHLMFSMLENDWAGIRSFEPDR